MKIDKQVLSGFSQYALTTLPQLIRFSKQWGLVWVMALGLFMLLFSGCVKQGIVITHMQDGQSVQVHTGDTVVLQLDENPSTGFTWEVSQIDTNILTLQDTSYTPEPGNPGETGRGGMHFWTFVTKHPGTVHLQLKNWRSFEGASSHVRWYNVTLEVQR